MNVDTLLGNFEILAEAPDGIEKLRELILRLAAEGLLIDPSLSENEIVELIASNNKSANKPELKSFCNSRGKVVYEIQIADAADLVQQAQSKIKTNQIKPSGAYPVVDQGQQFISGFVDGIAPINASGNAVLVFGDHTRNIKYIDFDFVVGADGVKVLRTKYLDPKFFYYMARSINLPSRGYGRHYRAFCSSYIPIFSQTEQMMTVSTIEKLMALCDQLEQQQKHRDNLRTATRKSAIDTISTATTPEELETAWRRINNNWDVIADTPESVESLRALILELALKGKFSGSDMGSWRPSTLGDEVQIIRGITFPSSAKTRTPGKGLVPCLRTANIQNEVDWDDLLYVSEEYIRNDNQRIQIGDLLISMANSRELVGKVALVRKCDVNCTLGGFIAAIRCGTGIEPKYLMTVLRVPSAREKLIDSSTQTTNIANISLGRLRPFVLNVPPLAEQKRIVAKVDELMALCDQLESELKSRSEVAEKFARSVVSAA
jgi:hypothetical protein